MMLRMTFNIRNYDTIACISHTNVLIRDSQHPEATPNIMPAWLLK